MAIEQKQIGTIQSLVDQVIAIDQQGIERTLIEGSAVYINDSVRTSVSASAEIRLINGKLISLSGNEQYSLTELLANKGFTSVAEMSPAELLQVLESIDDSATTEEKEQAIDAINQLTSGPGAEAAESDDLADQIVASGSDNDDTIDAINRLNEQNPPSSGDGQPALGPPAAGTGPQNQGSNTVALLEQVSTQGSVTPGHDRTTTFQELETPVNDLASEPFTTAITLADLTVTEEQQIIYTATLSTAPQTDFTVTLSNGVTIFFEAGSFTGSSEPQPAQGEDVFSDAETTTLTITSIAGGGYDAVEVSDTSSLQINDTQNTVTVRLTASSDSVTEGDDIEYIATLINADGLPVTGHDGVTVELSNGLIIDIPAGSEAGSANFTVTEDDILESDESIVNSITTANSNTLNQFENLVPDTAAITVNVIDDDAALVAIEATQTPMRSRTRWSG